MGDVDIFCENNRFSVQDQSPANQRAGECCEEIVGKMWIYLKMQVKKSNCMRYINGDIWRGLRNYIRDR